MIRLASGRFIIEKNFKLTADEIRPLAIGYGSCFASNMITVDGSPVGFMYREQPDHDSDSGWRFMSGYESDAYMHDPENFAIYDVNTIANYDPSIVSFLDSPTGSEFEKPDGHEQFVLIEDGLPPDDE